MTKANNPYLLPQRAPLTNGDDTFEPKRFKRLVEELPMGSVGQVSQNIHQLLKQMNAAKISVANRVSNLEALLEPLLFTLNTLSKGFSRELLPLNKRSTLMSELYGALCILTAQGYKVILDQYHHESLAGQLLHKSNRTMALHRVLYFLGQGLLHAYQLYRPAPEYIWHEIHGIHRYAVDQKLANRMVDNEDQQLAQQSSVNDLYKQILLISLAGPYRLMQGEVKRVYLALARWAPEAHLLDLGKTNGDAGPFIVDIGVDEPPRFKGAERDHQVLKGWVLDTSDLAVKLASELEMTAAPHGVMRPQETLDKISPDLMARLMLTWGIGSKRVADRDETAGEVALVCGLEAIYAAVGGERIPEPATKPGTFNGSNQAVETKKPSGIPRAHLEGDEHVIYDAPELTSIRQWITESNEPVPEVKKPAPVVEDEAPELIRPDPRSCLVYNESSSGYHLGWTGGRDEQISVGELVAVASQNEGESDLLRLGVIRWMRVERPDVIDFGVELFAGDTTPVIFSRQWGRHKQQGYWPGLLQHRPNEDPTLITSPFYSEESDQTWLTEQNDKRLVILSRVIESTASFIQFYYRDPTLTSSESTTDGEFDEKDFDQLWTSL